MLMLLILANSITNKQCIFVYELLFSVNKQSLINLFIVSRIYSILVSIK